jgi:hypothetical protein
MQSFIEVKKSGSLSEWQGDPSHRPLNVPTIALNDVLREPPVPFKERLFASNLVSAFSSQSQGNGGFGGLVQA